MLLPIGDDNTERVSFPVMTLTLIGVNVVMFLLELSRGDAFVMQYSIIPADLLSGHQPITNIITSMFLHSGISHIFFNMLYLFIFGDNVEDNLGKGKFLIFYLLCGIIAMVAQTMANPNSNIPNLGASGAIAGVLAGYLILFPRNRVRVMIFFPLTLTMTAWVVLGLWIVSQLFSGWTATYHTQASTQGGIAYMAHIGGFFAGVVLTFIFRKHEAKHGTMQRLGMNHD
jgi:membrane associated rhomboid family serine protease